jgi:hypothetical protein
MNDFRKTDENGSPTANVEYARLAERPERRSGRRVGAWLFILCGCFIILGGASVLAWQLTSHANAPIGPSSIPTSSSPSAKQPASCTGAREPVDVIQQQTAQGLHLTVAQVQAQVLAGKTIAQIATEQGLTAAQLRDVEMQALRMSRPAFHKLQWQLSLSYMNARGGDS